MPTKRLNYLTNDALLISVTVTFIRYIVNGVTIVSYLDGGKSTNRLLRGTLAVSTVTVALAFGFYWATLIRLRWLDNGLLCMLSLIACLASTACLSMMCAEPNKPEFVLMQSFDPLVLFAFVITAASKRFVLPIALLPFTTHLLTQTLLVGFSWRTFMTLFISTTLLLGVGYMLSNGLYNSAIELIKAELDPQSAALRLPEFPILRANAQRAIERFYLTRLTEAEAAPENLARTPTGYGMPAEYPMRGRNVTYCREMTFRRRASELLGSYGRRFSTVVSCLPEESSSSTSLPSPAIQMDASDEWASETWGQSCDDDLRDDSSTLLEPICVCPPPSPKWQRLKERSERDAAMLLERIEVLAWAQIRRDMKMYRQREILGSARINTAAMCTRILTRLRIETPAAKRGEFTSTVCTQNPSGGSCDFFGAKSGTYIPPPFREGVDLISGGSSLNSDWLDKASAQLLDRRRASRRSTINTSFDDAADQTEDRKCSAVNNCPKPAASNSTSEGVRQVAAASVVNGLRIDYLNFSGRHRVESGGQTKSSDDLKSRRGGTFRSESGTTRVHESSHWAMRNLDRQYTRAGTRRSPTVLSLNSCGKTTSESAGVSTQDSLSYLPFSRKCYLSVGKTIATSRFFSGWRKARKTVRYFRRYLDERKILIEFASWRASPLMPFQTGFFPQFVSPDYERWWQDWHDATRSKSPRHRFIRVLIVALINASLAAFHFVGLPLRSPAVIEVDVVYIIWTLFGQTTIGVVEMTLAYTAEARVPRGVDSVTNMLRPNFTPAAYHFHRSQAVQICVNMISLFILLIKVRRNEPSVNMTLVLAELLFNICLPFLTTELPAIVLAAWATCVSIVTASLVIWAWGNISLPRDLIVLVSIWEITFIVYYWHSRLVTLFHRRIFAVTVLPVVIYLNEIGSSEFLPVFLSAAEVDGKRILSSQSPFLQPTDAPKNSRPFAKGLRRGREEYTKRGLESWMNI